MDSRGRLNAEDLDNLRAFAQRVEKHIVKAGGNEAMERLVCRILNNKKQPQVAGALACKWVEWRYGKSVEIKHSGTVTHEHIDLSNLSDEQLRQVEAIVESAHTGADQG